MRQVAIDAGKVITRLLNYSYYTCSENFMGLTIEEGMHMRTNSCVKLNVTKI